MVTNTYEQDAVVPSSFATGYLEITIAEDLYRESTDRGDLGIADYIETEAPSANETPVDEQQTDQNAGWF